MKKSILSKDVAHAMFGDAGEHKPDSREEKTTDGERPATEKKKVTYYIWPEMIRELKILAAKTDRDLSDLVSEAIEDILTKHNEK